MREQEVSSAISQMVHDLYWTHDINCARTTLMVLSRLFDHEIHRQTLHSAIGLHGAGGYRGQCGLVEGTLMFISLYAKEKLGLEDAVISGICFDFAEKFERHFSSLSCAILRPGGFNEDDPPHLCEELTNRVIEYGYRYIASYADGK
ncbi:MAG TPA: C-GCAxxG-C-C family (seleno)protein [Synergistaceae bacterium]|nr:C-GCAxxG-C-C family (seleno)protein [Synergistaceae bacterium]HPQ36022.1 C-GCAxxG-C-C family (seleno)protein [Synergistaceae bacterium]